MVVTGAAGGIGGALVRALVEHGARSVVAADLDASGVERLSEELGAGKVVPRALDVTDEQATRALVEEVEGAVGSIDVWFANAGLATGSGTDAATTCEAMARTSRRGSSRRDWRRRRAS